MWIKTDPPKADGYSFLLAAPEHMPATDNGTIWTASPKSRQPVAVRATDDGLWQISTVTGPQVFRSLRDALEWAASQ